MNFKKKMKVRLYFAVFYMILGVITIIMANIYKKDFFSSYGLALFLVGAVQIRNYLLITKNEETMKRREISEKDERNISISDKAKSFAFIAYIYLASVLVIVFQAIGKKCLATVMADTVCILMVFYWIAYFVIRRKS